MEEILVVLKNLLGEEPQPWEEEMKRKSLKKKAENDRRVAPRLIPENPLIAKVRAFHPARVLNISTTGSLLAITLPLKPQSTCDLRIGDNSHEIVLRGTVKRSWLKGFHTFDDGSRATLYHAALEFDNPHPSLLDRLTRRLGFDVQLEFEDETVDSPVH
jgi:hypothetical protein